MPDVEQHSTFGTLEIERSVAQATTQATPQTTTQGSGRRPSGLGRPDLHRPDLGWRAVVALAAVVAGLAGAPTYVVGVLVAAGLGLAVERLARSRGRDAGDSLVVLVGGVVVVLVLTGLVLGATPIGLRTTTWAVALGVVALVGLGVATTLPRPAYLSRASWLTGARSLPWAVAVVAVAAIAIGISVRSVGPAEAQPLQLSFGRIDGTQVQVVVSSSERAGPLELRTIQGGNEISYPLFELGAGRTYKTTLAVPATGRFTITLDYPDQTQPLRTLVLDR